MTNDIDGKGEEKSFKRFSIKRKAERRKKQRQREQATGNTPGRFTLPRNKTALWKVILQFTVNSVALLFIITALLGGFLNLKSYLLNEELSVSLSKSNQPIVTESDWEEAKAAALLAFTSSWIAIRLWSRLFIQYLIPTSHATYAITKDGFVAMQPSLNMTLEFINDLPTTFKILIATVTACVIGMLFIVEQARKRKLLERAMNSYYNIEDRIVFTYTSFITRVRKRSQIVASFVPHVLYGVLASTWAILFPDHLSQFSKGVGGWFVVIGIPTILSTVSLVLYDEKYLNRIKKLNKQKKRKGRRTSILPKINAETPDKKVSRGFMATLFGEKENDINKLVDYESDDEMRRILPGKKSMRGINPAAYPKILDSDDKSSEEQAHEISRVLSWLKYWMVFGFALALEQLPLSGHLLAILPIWPTLRILLALWMYLPFTKGASLAFDFSLPLIDKHWKKIQVLSPTASGTDFSFLSKYVIYQLPVSRMQKQFLSEVGETGSTLVFTAIPFFLLPSFISAIGIVYIGLIRPIYQGYVTVYTFELVVEQVVRRNQQKHGKGYSSTMARRRKRVVLDDGGAQGDTTVASTCLHCTTWLEYWVVYALAMFLVGALSSILNIMPLGNQLQLAVLLWLQLPYFRGARQVFKALLKQYYRIRKSILGKPNQPRRIRQPQDEVVMKLKFETPVKKLEIKDEYIGSGYERSINEEELMHPPSPSASGTNLAEKLILEDS